MKTLRYILTLSVSCLISCSDISDDPAGEDKKDKMTVKAEKCICDSIGKFKEDGKEVIQCFIGKSMIEITDISANKSGDTLAVSRYTKSESLKWRIQEATAVVNEKIFNPEKAFYCDFKEEKEGYRVAFISNERLRVSKDGPFPKRLVSEYVIINSDTIRTGDSSVLIHREKFKGMIQLNKVMVGVYKGEEGNYICPMYIEAENLIRYGNLLEQYKAINRLCNKKKAPR